VKPLRFTTHAMTAFTERELALDWVERIVREPEWTAPDPTDPSLERRFGMIRENGNRVLRVVCRDLREEVLVVTLFFDRKARRP
jgi:hypothetical protein